MGKSLFEKNIKALEERFPGLAYRIKNKMYELSDDIIVQVEEARDFSQIFKVKKTKRVLYLNGKYGPKKEIEDFIAQMKPLNKKTTIFLFGIGDGIILKELLQNIDKEINIAVFEPSINIFMYAMQNVDLQEIYKDRAVGLVVNGLNEEEKRDVVSSFLTIGNLAYIKKIVHPNYEELFPEDIIKDMKTIQRRIDRIIVSENTAVVFSNIATENIFRNIMYMPKNYIATEVCQVVPLDIPVIIVAAGPSLNKNIKELKRAKNKAFIIAVDTALKLLIKEEIIPDLFVVIDPIKPLELFQEKGVENIPMLCSITASYKVLEFHKGKKFFFKEAIPYINKLFDDLEITIRAIGTGGSVATTAFSFAYLSGFSTIILVGQDLALTGNKTHADGTFKEKMDEIDTKSSIMVEGNFEPLVPTRMDFKVFLDWYNDYIAQSYGVHVINATEGGAKINNTEILSLKEAIDRECKKEVFIAECYDKLKPMFSEEQQGKAAEYFQSTPDMLYEMKKKAMEGKRLYKKLSNSINSKKIDKKTYQRLNKKIAKVMSEIEGMLIAPLILDCLGVANYLIRSELYEEEREFEEEVKEIARKGITVLEYVIQCIDLFLPLVKDTVCKIQE